jgi:hypothetical protein
MTRRTQSMTVLGASCLLAALALAPGGVRAERAAVDPQAAAAPPAAGSDAPMCSAAPAPHASAADALARLRAELAARGTPPGVVPLGNRGHNYGPPVIDEPALLERDAREQRGSPSAR